jgi:hypothetical protein
MKATQILPTAMIVLNILAALVYAGAHNWRQTIYWTAAAVITASVTF